MGLSVIIPCYNAEATLTTQLEALSTQQWSQPWELIISDNGCTDNSMEIARECKDHFPGFRIVDSSRKKRQSHALNVGIRAARYDKLAFCDADDEVAPGWLASMGDALQKYDVVYGQFHFDKFNEPCQAEHAAQKWKNGLYKGLFLPGGGAGNLGILRWVHEAIGGFDECLPRFVDSDYYWKLQLEGFELHYAPEAMVQVRRDRINPSLSYLYLRHRTATAARHWLYKRYRHLGMLPHPHLPLNNSLAGWVRVLRTMKACLRSKQGRGIWLMQFVQQTGDLVGQIQGRITTPCKPYHPVKRSLDKN